jgi:hypothetical protein
MGSVADVKPLIMFQGAGHGIIFWCGMIDRVSGLRAWDQFLMWNDWLCFRTQGMMSSGFRVLFSEGGSSLYKGSDFPLLSLSSIPSPLTLNSLSLHTLYPLTWPPTLKRFSVLLVRLVVPQSGIWNQSGVSSLVPLLRTQCVFSFYSFNSISNILLFFLSRTGCPFTWIPELLRGLCTPLITMLNNIPSLRWSMEWRLRSWNTDCKIRLRKWRTCQSPLILSRTTLNTL